MGPFIPALILSSPLLSSPLLGTSVTDYTLVEWDIWYEDMNLDNFSWSEFARNPGPGNEVVTGEKPISWISVEQCWGSSNSEPSWNPLLATRGDFSVTKHGSVTWTLPVGYAREARVVWDSWLRSYEVWKKNSDQSTYRRDYEADVNKRLQQRTVPCIIGGGSSGGGGN